MLELENAHSSFLQQLVYFALPLASFKNMLYYKQHENEKGRKDVCEKTFCTVCSYISFF